MEKANYFFIFSFATTLLANFILGFYLLMGEMLPILYIFLLITFVLYSYVNNKLTNGLIILGLMIFCMLIINHINNWIHGEVQLFQIYAPELIISFIYLYLPTILIFIISRIVYCFILRKHSI